MPQSARAENELCPACPREPPRASYAVEWDPSGWTLVGADGRTAGTPVGDGGGVRPWHFKTSEKAVARARELLRKIDPEGELATMCGDCPYLPTSNEGPARPAAAEKCGGRPRREPTPPRTRKGRGPKT